MNVMQKLWPENIYTRHAYSRYIDGITTSRLDYVFISKTMQQFNQTAEPLYTANMALSDHINIKCSNRIATTAYPAVTDSPKMVCSPPTTTGRNNECPYCNKICQCANALIVHIRSHTGEKPFSCSKLCGARFSSDHNANTHEEGCSGPIILKTCPHCVFHTYNQKIYDIHVPFCKNKKTIGGFRCVACNFTTNKRGEYNKHLETRGHNTIHNLKGYACLPCNLEFFNINTYNDHVATPRHADRCSDSYGQWNLMF